VSERATRPPRDGGGGVSASFHFFAVNAAGRYDSAIPSATTITSRAEQETEFRFRAHSDADTSDPPKGLSGWGVLSEQNPFFVESGFRAISLNGLAFS
jgi:hypothetical protein